MLVEWYKLVQLKEVSQKSLRPLKELTQECGLTSS